ncbi:MAG: heavy-metal-associated domain-containing protein [Ruminococcaceae bacterium]|nr:heavy-metal-associated domain-containing protein [Oscillospiraceae bacterium]
MKKVYRIENLDCAHCAAKMEQAIGKLDGVESVSISFLTQKLILNTEESKLEQILTEAEKICKKIEPDCAIKR